MVVDVVLLNGTVGVGKTTTADHLGRLLVERQVAHAVIDLDETRRMWPSPSEDRFHRALSLRNLGMLVGNYRAAGARRLVVAGVAETAGDVMEVEKAVGGPVSVVRLVGSGEIVDARLSVRHRQDPEGLRWHLDRRRELDALLDTAELGHQVVRIDGLDAGAVAARVAALVDW